MSRSSLLPAFALLLTPLWASFSACGGWDSEGTPPVQDDDSAGGDDDSTPYTEPDDDSSPSDDDSTPTDDDSAPVDGDGDGVTVGEGDCDDEDASTWPGAPEEPDGADNDCDGLLDEGSSAYDDDGDGQSEDEGDCDDADVGTYTGAAEYGDGEDNDCDGAVDEGTDGFDDDGDGFSEAEGDCDDGDATSHPGSPEAADGMDNDCDGIADEETSGYDDDGDTYSEDEGDCNDGNAAVHPNAAEDGGTGTLHANGLDDNCNGLVDDGTLEFDDDGDGYSDLEGDCDDFNPDRAPGAPEDASDGVDNDCDGSIDEVPSCDCSGSPTYPQSMELCEGVISSSTSGNASSRAVATSLGTITPKANCTMVLLSSGVAGAADNQPGSDLGSGGSSGDTSSLTLQLQVPETAEGFSFQFYFLSAEYPEWVGSAYNDKFTATLTSGAYSGNVSYDEYGNAISINSLFFTVTSPSLLTGTGFASEGGGTGWLTTTAPLIGGEVATLVFSIGDVSDGIYDSAVVIDNFRWVYSEVGDPNTND